MAIYRLIASGTTTGFDAILVIVIGSIASRAISGTAPFFSSLAGTFVGVLANEDYPDTDRQLASVENAASEIGLKISIQNVRSDRDLDGAFSALSQLKVDALLVAADPLFSEMYDQIVALTTRYKIPAIYASREFVVAGGVISYGASVADAHRGAVSREFASETGSTWTASATTPEFRN